MFPQRLKQLRKEMGLSQKSLSEHLGVTQQAVGKWETGRSSPDPATLARLAELLETSADYLLGISEQPAEPAAPSPALWRKPHPGDRHRAGGLWLAGLRGGLWGGIRLRKGPGELFLSGGQGRQHGAPHPGRGSGPGTQAAHPGQRRSGGIDLRGSEGTLKRYLVRAAAWCCSPSTRIMRSWF